ncbi:chromosome partitioning protein [Actinoplanes sp. NEAU-A12]|uniref:Chromosome partitioning protein n=1 Tax=Actinoplanes sandaracinus TaxID=3045177 RepID=A0ABT6WSZ0_9ACTN|nr:chromosome partitioning protein [Actinoplanes sandaracinus]MDI6102863.1 chromosome partitioning protein [Actinoplanes sandaracinus]
MTEEHADRVYVPGTEPTPPARDVEPFWADEPETPVHGRAVPLADRVPPIEVPQFGMAQVEPGVFRPAGDPDLPPGVHVPAQRAPSAERPESWPPPDATTAAPAPAPQADPNGWPGPAAHTSPAPQRHPHPAAEALPRPNAHPTPDTLPGPDAHVRPNAHPTPDAHPGHTAADSPWAQPLHRPTTPVQQETAPIRPGQGAAQQGQAPVVPQPPPRPVPVQPVSVQPVSVQPVSVQPISVQPVPVQPVPPAQPTAVPPQAQHTPRPPQGAAETWPPAHAAPVPPHAQHPSQPPQGAAETWPSAHVAPVPSPAVQAGPADPGCLNIHQPPPTEEQDQARQSGGGEADPFQELNWMADATPTAEEFARRRLAKPAQQTATMGARAILQKGMLGLVKLSPGQRELEYKQDVEMVRRNFGGLRQVTVVNPKGGAGKTVAVLLLAMTFGQKRGGYVLAWDNNETQGTLGMRAQQDFHARTVRDMMRDLHLFQGAQGRVGDLSQYVRAQGEGMFDVLASDESATAGEMLTATSFAEIRDVVSRFYKLIFVDTGNNVRAENWQAAMDATDQLVITMSARNDSAETAARALDHLEQSGRRRLVRQAVTIVTMPPTRKDIDLQWIQQHFAARTRAVLVAPYERLIDSGEPIRYGELSGQTKDAWLKIAAAVADGL